MIDTVTTILKRLNDYSIPGFVAGGWIRDMVNGIEPKDIDIFVPNGYETFHRQIRSCLMYEVIEHPRYYPNYQDFDMRDDVIGVLKYKQSDIDIIIMDHHSVEDIIFNFDVSVCQIYGKLGDSGIDVFASEDYLDWVQRGIIYKYTDIPTTENHLERVRSKFNVELTPKTSDQIKRTISHIGEL